MRDGSSSPNVGFCSVYDSSPGFGVQLNIWLVTLEERARVPRANIVVHLLEDDDTADIARALDSRGIGHRTISRFGDGKYCNKIAQCDNDDLTRFDYVVFCDLDVAFADGIERWIGIGDVAAKPVDLPNPPVETLNRIYEAAGFATRPDVVSCIPSPSPTYANNCNGGLYILRARVVPELGAAWKKWARWLLERPEMLGTHAGHVDQIAFGLATWALGTGVVPLPLEANTPTHLDATSYPSDVRPPLVLHYHHNIGRDGTLNPVGVAPIDERIGIVNATLQVARPVVAASLAYFPFRDLER